MNRPTYAEPTLDLFPDELDVELPLDEAPDELSPEEAASAAWHHKRVQYRDALADVLDALERGRDVPANRLRSYRLLVGLPAVVDEAATPEERRDEGIARAAAKWTDDEVALVDLAIVHVRNAVVRLYEHDGRVDESLLEFTTADVWRELAGRVPVTKGIAGRMLAAKSAGVIVNTGRTVIAPRESTGPNHGQRLTVWRAA